jgi:DNA polymerase-3 subunit delta'
MRFEAIIGQDRTKQLLTQMAYRQRTPHALLLLGPSGAGNLGLALAMAQMLQCEQPIPTDACGVCNACTKAAANIHPDIHFSYPTIGTNAVSTDFLPAWRAAIAEGPYFDANDWLQRIGAENKQGNINKEECVAIMRKLSLQIFEGRRKILLMWLPEYLGKEGNRLLKLIEEPPDNTIFLLVAENAELILNTILSRCQLVKVDSLHDEEIEQALVAHTHMTPERARGLAFLADGNYHRATQLAEQEGNDDAALFLDWLRKCWKGHGVELTRQAEVLSQLGRENQKQFILYALHFLRELLALTATGQSKLRLRPEELATAQNMAKVLDWSKINDISRLLNDKMYHIERNANPKILFLDAGIALHGIMTSKPQT